ASVGWEGWTLWERLPKKRTRMVAWLAVHDYIFMHPPVTGACSCWLLPSRNNNALQLGCRAYVLPLHRLQQLRQGVAHGDDEGGVFLPCRPWFRLTNGYFIFVVKFPRARRCLRIKAA